MKIKTGVKVRWLGSSTRLESQLTVGKIYTVRPIDENTYCLIETGDASYPAEEFEIVEVRAGTKVRWLGRTEWLILTHNKIYDVVSVEKEWYRIIDDSGEDYLYPPEMFEIVED